MDNIEAAKVTLERHIRQTFKGREQEAWLRWLDKKCAEAQSAERTKDCGEVLREFQTTVA